MNKKIITLAAVAALTATSAFADGDISVSVNGTDVVFDQAPVIENDRTLVPMRAIFEALGATVEWDGETRTVTSTKPVTAEHKKTVKLTIDSADMQIIDSVGTASESAVVTLDVPAKIINDRTMVPVRAISEAMACVVEWDGEARAVIITTNDAPVATEAPEQSSNSGSTSGGSVSISSLPQVEAKEGVNTYVPDLVTGAIDPATGEVVDNAERATTNYAPVNGGKQYFADVYHPNVHQYAGLIKTYAFYDSNKSFISGGTDDMSKLVTAPENAAYIRYTINAKLTSRHILYVNFMETSTVPTDFEKSEAITSQAKTDKFEGKSIYILGDSQLNNGDQWLIDVDKALNADKIYVKGEDGLRYTAQTGVALASDSFISGLPKSGYDMVIVHAGAYDWMMNMPIADFEKAVNTFATKAKAQFSGAEIYLMTLTSSYYPGGFADGVTNGEGLTQADYSAVIKKVAAANGLKVIDLGALWTSADAQLYYRHTDGDTYLFTNEAGSEKITDAIVKALTE